MHGRIHKSQLNKRTFVFLKIDAALVDRAQAAGHVLHCLQSNAEHVLVERIHAAHEDGMRVASAVPSGPLKTRMI